MIFDVVLGRQSVELFKCLLLEKMRFTATKFAYKRIFKLLGIVVTYKVNFVYEVNFVFDMEGRLRWKTLFKNF